MCWIPPENLTGADPKIVSVLLLARTLSNTKGVRVLLQKGRTLEARILENGFWLARLIEDGSSFVQHIIEDEQKRRSMRGQVLFDTQVQLEAEAEKRLRDWMKEQKHWKDGLSVVSSTVLGLESFSKIAIGTVCRNEWRCVSWSSSREYKTRPWIPPGSCRGKSRSFKPQQRAGGLWNGSRPVSR
ncbi:hypothetical protein [Bradyrhizobium sp. ERR14]|uniref:hypothetical protein n=1 Tax=Bradyrhizobium sp. ERR14 TaxID=2663837 RepID=UPI00162164C8|nr:hypothetical protein [Bradyrhizobium sp. ERR14]MBB4398800.1 hypothetical protein [Bradyrhizobium sp. ERR14]